MRLFLERSPVSGPRWMEGDEARVQSLDRWKAEPDGQMLSTPPILAINILQPWTLTIWCCESINTCSLKATHFQHIDHCKWNIPSKGKKKQGCSAKCEPSTRCGCGWLVTPSINNIDSSLQNSGSGHLARGHLPGAALQCIVPSEMESSAMQSYKSWQWHWTTCEHVSMVSMVHSAPLRCNYNWGHSSNGP